MRGLIVLIFPLILLAQDNYEFGQSIIVNDDPPGTHWQSATQRSIGCCGDTVYLVWRDDRYGSSIWYNSRIFFSKSTDAGNTWNPNLMIGNGSDTLWNFGPHLALDAFGNIYIGYPVQNQNNNNSDVYFTKSTDGGITFTTPIIVNDSSDVVYQAGGAIAVDSSGQYVYVVWEDSRNGHDEDIYLARSTDGGMGFFPSVLVNDGSDSADQWYPVIACDNSGQYVYVAWQDFRDIGYGANVYFARSTDYGQTFEQNYCVNDTTTTGNSKQGNPSIYYRNGIIYLAWRDERDGARVYSAKSIDNGVSFELEVQVPDDSGIAAHPSIAADDLGNVYVVWYDSRTFGSTGYDIYFSLSDDSGMTFKPDVRVNDLLGIYSAWDKRPAVAVNEEGTVFVAWSSDRNGILNYDIYFAAGSYMGIQEYCDHKPAITVMCYPNPFREKTDIRYQMADGGSQMIDNGLQIKIYDISGRMVRQFDYTTIGLSNQLTWFGDDKYDHQVPAGIYFICLRIDGKKCVEKLIKIGG